MRITPVDPGIDLGYLAGKRSVEKVHMSDIYNDLYARMEPERYGEKPDEDPRLRDAYMSAGVALETILEEGLKRRLASRPGEIIEPEHGIAYNPDLIVFNGVTRCGEIKLTWMSMDGLPREEAESFPPKFAKYVTQMACYCYCLETPHARLIVFAVNSSYKWKSPRAFKPELLAWDITFTKRELHEEWQRVIKHGQHMRLL